MLFLSVAFTLAFARVPEVVPPLGFDAELRAIARAVACDGSSEPRFAADLEELVGHHCAQVAELVTWHARRWVSVAEPFLRELVPADAPDVVVYPFGGADLGTALLVFPDAREITTLGLEHGGDPRTLAHADAADLAVDLERYRAALEHLYAWSWSRTFDLYEVKKAALPSSLALDVAGLVVRGYRPVGLRYFELTAGGDIRYLTAVDIARAEATAPASGSKHHRAMAARFASFELRYLAPNDPNERVFRHIAANLDDVHLARDDRALKHLAAKGRVAIMTKAASYLLWWNSFTRMRGYLLDHLAWMVSDSTGVPPSLLDKRFTQTTWGRFAGSFIGSSKSGSAALQELFAAQPERPLAFEFGYPDVNGAPHLIVTTPR